MNLIEIRGFGGKVIESITTSAPEAEFQNITTTETVSDKEFTIIRAKEDKHLVLDNIALIIWVTVSLILLSLFVRQILKIISLRRVATKEVHSDYSIYRLWSGSLIFSFLKDVYIAQNIEGEKFDFILQHELEHIRKRHYVDKMIAEIYSSIIWFNPIVKVIQRELSLIHEYEADHAVVESGCNIKAYKIFIFEEASTAIPAFVNGINSSQIKNRFITMDKKYKVSHRVLRVCMTIFTLVVIVATSIMYVEAKEPQRTITDNIPPEEIKSIDVNKESGLITIYKKDGTVVSYNENEPLKVNYYNPGNTNVTKTSTVKKAPCEDSSREQYYITPRNRNNKPIYVVRYKDHTKVFIKCDIYWNRHFVVFSDEMWLTDKNGGDKYMIHSSASGLPLNKLFWVYNQKGKSVYFELIFPPLDKKIDQVNLVEWSKAATTEGYGNRPSTVDGIGWHFENVSVDKKMLPFFTTDEYQRSMDEKKEIRLDEDFKLKK